MKKKLKKNQVMITALALMIAIAGYMQFSGDYLNKEKMEETKMTSGDSGEYSAELDIITDEEEVISMLDMDLSDITMEDVTGAEGTYVNSSDVVAQMESGTTQDNAMAGAQVPEGETPGEAVYTTTTVAGMTLTDAKLLKEQTRAQNKSGLLEIINNSQLAESAKQSAVEKLVTLTDIAERELAAEIMLEAKGFYGAIVSISGENVDVVLDSADLTDVKRAQVEDIVKRKTGIPAENIVISSLVEN